MKNYFEVICLRKSWPMKDVEISLEMEKGEALALLGPSGCGKSSALRMIAGLLTPDSGSIMLDGIDITSLSPGKRKTGMVFQEHALFPHLSVEDNIGYGLVAGGAGRKESRKKAAEWLELMGLEGFAKRRPESLSGGEKQRVSLARTLAVEPLLVLFDEPLSSLDAGLRARLQEELRSRQREAGYTALYVTHDEQEAEILADRIIRMV
ncbi:ABC transporter ATP-binding protein [Brucepastera parasyntrophica]|uniref:ABC transporter ATP-binding protein n=1 Tax=Brucepastera parasyntrophica TaxID=2880008 RepID=UPI00210AD9B7|nr:ABC transporter ATP-binding protein [Brucepastera parasyntrophica]ULQ61084.1 ABC transporter ATP-binding protein [Brucepastera parasyntrophica]